MKFVLPYNAKVSIESSIDITILDIEDSYDKLSNALVESIIYSNTSLSNEVIDIFFKKHEDKLLKYLVSSGYIVNKE